MTRNHNRSLIFLLVGLFILATTAVAAPPPDGFKTIQNPSGGSIMYGPLTGQPTLKTALGQALRQVHDYWGDRPQLGSIAMGGGGNLLAGFFTVAAKRQDGKQMTGLLIVCVRQGQMAGTAVLSDYSDRFPSSANSLLQRLLQELGGKPAAPAPQALQPTRFPDGSGLMGLPAGWSMTRAKLGDVMAKGPAGEILRFGWTILVIDPRGSGLRQLGGRGGQAPGQFLTIPFGIDPTSAYKSAMAQLAAKNRNRAPEIKIDNVREIPMQGGSNHFLYGDIDMHDGQDAQLLVVQMITTPPQAMGTWQMTLFQIQGPKQAMIDERATISAIYPNYSRNSNYVNHVMNAEIAEGFEQTKAFVGEVARHVDDSNRFTAGMSDYLRGDTVLRDTQLGGHLRRPDEAADALIASNPGRFEKVPLSDYVSGIDY